MIVEDKIFIGSNDNTEIYLLPKLANRHGLIAGATGTGKTITLKALAESFSDLGVPVFLADMKGDISGLSKQGELNEKINERIDKYNLKDKGFNFKSYPVEFWDLFGEKGLPVRVTISQMGPTLLSKILNLTEAQEGILNIVFKVADAESLLLIDIKDLKSMINHVVENRAIYESQYGSISTRSANTILRSLLSLEDQGGNNFFGEPALELTDFIQCDDEGKGVINILDAVKLSLAPQLYSTFLLWMLTELYETLPEVGDLEKPKFVFFFDEAHLLFDEMNPTFQKKIEQIVRLIRSKGVGLYFISQSPSDIPENILAQLGNRIQHALRAYTPKDQKSIKAAAESFRPNPELDTKEEISNLGIGEALVSLLDEDGVPGIVEKVDIIPPQSYTGGIDDGYRNELINMSVYKQKYMEALDRVSAYEVLLEKVEQVDSQTNTPQESSADTDVSASTNNDLDFNPNHSNKTTKNSKNKSQSQKKDNSDLDKLAATAANTMAREVSKHIVRGLFGQMKLF